MKRNKSVFDKLLIIITLLMISFLAFSLFFKEPKDNEDKEKEKKNQELVYFKDIKEGEDVYKFTLHYLKNCNYGEGNKNKLSGNSYFYQKSRSVDQVDLDQKFYCSLQFLRNDDLGIKNKKRNEFDRRQLNTYFPVFEIANFIENIFATKEYPKKTYRQIYLDKLNVYVDIIYNKNKDAYLFKAIYDDEIEKKLFKDYYSKYVNGKYLSETDDNKEDSIVYKEKFFFVDELYNPVKKVYEVKIYNNYNHDQLIDSFTVKKNEKNPLKHLKDEYFDKGSEIEFFFKKKNDKWFFEKSVIKVENKEEEFNN